METLQTDLSAWQAGARMAMALVAAGIIGWEREAKGRSAGLRTHMLVALGAAGFTLVAIELQIGADPKVQLIPEPVHIIAAIVGGVGFLGAGTIIQSRGEVTGLTTAASIWLVAAIGIAAGCGFYVIATLLSGFGLVTLILIKILEDRFVANDANDQ